MPKNGLFEIASIGRSQDAGIRIALFGLMVEIENCGLIRTIQAEFGKPAHGLNFVQVIF